MATDRARNSYEPTRMYRSVVAQQGRVTVEADQNEAERIHAAASRAELLEIVGPTGTPDDGFKISISAPMDFDIHAGTMYVGGVRIEASASYSFTNQSEWLDARPPTARPEGAFAELVYLEVVEREVTAVEDRSLREIALGGPDTSARTRMQTRVHRTLATGTCEDALGRALALAYPNATFDAATRLVGSKAKLKVGFASIAGDVDPCLPTARSGFLGADNQLIRVQATTDGALLWGWDNASFLYRATITSVRTLVIDDTPVDVFHFPQAGQWIEVLEIAGMAGDARLAALAGEPRRLAGYNHARKELELRADLASSERRHVYVRVWQDRVELPPNATTPADLGTTGVQIYVQARPSPGDFWMIGLRPSTPQVVYPKRLETFQAPDGPLRWVTPLAMLKWNAAHTTADVHDCRRPFDSLTELTRTRCCELVVHPGDRAQDIEAAIAARLARNKLLGVDGLHVKFVSGVFTFERTLSISGGTDLTVSGCGATSRLRSPGTEAVIAMTGWNTVTVRDLTVHGGASSAVGSNNHLNGALTFRECRAVDVERVLATCTHSKYRAATCITTLCKDTAPGELRIRGCELVVGLHQTGLLAINMRRATIDDNEVQLPDLAKLGVVDAGNPGDLRRALYSHMRIVSGDVDDLPVSLSQVEIKRPLGPAGELRFVTEKELASAWTRALAPLETATGTIGALRRAAQSLVDRIIAQILAGSVSGPLTAVILRDFVAALERAGSRLLVAAGQGIVVGGAVAGEIRIRHNTISGVKEGIRIGLSGRKNVYGNKLLRANDVLIDGNTIHLRIPTGTRGYHAGIFVGNVRFAAIRDNRIAIQDEDDGVIEGEPPDGEEYENHQMRRTDGIRLYGKFGEKLAIEGNVTSHTRYPIWIYALDGAPTHANWWISRNVSIDALRNVRGSSPADLIDNR